MRLLQERGRKKRLEDYGEETTPRFSEGLERFRGEMLAAVDGLPGNSADDNDLLQSTFDSQQGHSSFIHEIEDEIEVEIEEEIEEEDVPMLEMPAANLKIEEIEDEVPVIEQLSIKSMIEEIEEDVPVIENPSIRPMIKEIVAEVPSPSKMYGFIRTSPPLNPIIEETEPDHLVELGLQRAESMEEISIPFHDRSSGLNSIVATGAWSEPIKESAVVEVEEETIEEIVTGTLVELENGASRQAWAAE